MTTSAILDRLDTIINRDDYSRTLGLSVLNELINWIENQGDWSHMESLDDTQQTVNGTPNYSVPSDFKHEIDIILEDTSGNVTYLKEKKSTIIDRSKVNTATTQKPYMYYYFGGSLYLEPTPNDDEWTIKQRYYAYSAALTDSINSSNALTTNHPRLLVSGCARDIFTIFEDDTSAKRWNTGGDSIPYNFISEWDAFKKKESRSMQMVSRSPRMGVRFK